MAENLSKTQDDYVRKDVFDARMDRMEMLLEKTTIEIKAYVDTAISEMKAENQQLRNELKTENQQLRNELKTENQQLRDELKTEIRDLRTEIRDVSNEVRLLSTRVDSLENVFYWGLGGFGIILASAILVPAIIGFLKKLFQPSITVEDVERIVEAAIARQLSGGRTE